MSEGRDNLMSRLRITVATVDHLLLLPATGTGYLCVCGLQLRNARSQFVLRVDR